MSLYLEGVGHFQSIEDLLDFLVQGGGINSGFTLSVLLFFCNFWWNHIHIVAKTGKASMQVMYEHERREILTHCMHAPRNGWMESSRNSIWWGVVAHETHPMLRLISVKWHIVFHLAKRSWLQQLFIMKHHERIHRRVCIQVTSS